jgi:hypothetical protein
MEIWSRIFIHLLDFNNQEQFHIIIYSDLHNNIQTPIELKSTK